MNVNGKGTMETAQPTNQVIPYLTEKIDELRTARRAAQEGAAANPGTVYNIGGTTYRAWCFEEGDTERIYFSKEPKK